jgi:glycosyltransferase involved in cell wall biosynthesis
LRGAKRHCPRHTVPCCDTCASIVIIETVALKLLINSLFRGGAEKQAAALSRRLPHDAFILLEREVNFSPESPRLEFLSDHTSYTSPFVKTLSIRSYAKKLAKLTSAKDVVLSFMERANLVNILAARAAGHRAVISERICPSMEFSGLRGLLMRPLIKRLYPEADLVVANSKGVKKDLEDNFGLSPEKVKVIYNGCDTEGINELAAEPLEDGWHEIFKHPVLIASGRLAPAKGHRQLLRIFSRLKKTRPDLRLVILGEGGCKAALLALARRLELRVFDADQGPFQSGPHDVYFPGFVSNPYKFIARARLFVFPSLWEGLPNALIEAMACGTPVVSADCPGGPREILAPDTPFDAVTSAPDYAPYGLLLPPLSGRPVRREPAEGLWAAAISDILDKPAALEKYAGAGSKRAEDFEFSRTAGLWRKVLDTLPQPEL